MKRYRYSREPNSGDSRLLNRWSAALAGCALALLAGSGLAYADDTTATTPAPKKTTDADKKDKAGDADELAAIEVTGIRAAIQSAIEVKRESGSIVEAISAEDIGKLPDTSIAESISRLPGLTSQRAEGRASAISLRGTDPGFTTGLMNGREQVSTGDNRSIEFDQYPSELLSGVVVYKTPDAQLVGQGLAGTIDLRTQRPLDYGKRAIVFNVRGERNSNNELGGDSTDKGYRASFSYVDQFLDNTFGIALGVARLETPLATEAVGTYEPWGKNGAGIYATNGMKVRSDMGKNRRDGALATLQWKPNDAYSSVLDFYYTKRKQTDNARSLEVNLGGYPGPCCDGTFPTGTVFGYTNTVNRDNSITGGTINTVVPLARNFLFNTQDKIFATGWNNKWSTGEWTLVGDLSYSKATRDEQQYETNAQSRPDTLAECSGTVPAPCHAAGTPRNVYDTGQFQLSTQHMPTLTFPGNYADPATINVGPTIYGAGYTKIPHVEDKLKSARIDVSRNLTNWFSAIGAGLNYSDRSKYKIQPEAGLNTIANATGGYHQIDPQYLLSPTNLSYAGTGQALAWDVPGVLGAYYQPIVYNSPTDAVLSPGNSFLIGKQWTVKEKVATLYLRGDLNHELNSSITLKGNIGVQVLKTDQSSDALRYDPANQVGVPYSDGKKYTDVLPAINLAFLLPEQQTLRLGLARELARPRMDQLKASVEFGVDKGTGLPGASAGNPRLDPWRADAIDLSYEKYFGNRAYVSVAAFMKNLKTYIYDVKDTAHDFSAFVSQLPPNYASVPLSNLGSLTAPVNGSGGKLKGVEFTVSLPGELFAEGLSGFGTILSISQTDSAIRVSDLSGATGTDSLPLPGLSKTVWSTTFYYEKSGFSARIATRARSKYIGEVTNFANERKPKFVKGDQITDFQTGYEFGDGRLKGLSVLFQVNNLTNEPYIAYSQVESRLQDYQSYGRQFLLGVNLKL